MHHLACLECMILTLDSSQIKKLICQSETPDFQIQDLPATITSFIEFTFSSKLSVHIVLWTGCSGVQLFLLSITESWSRVFRCPNTPLQRWETIAWHSFTSSFITWYRSTPSIDFLFIEYTLIFRLLNPFLPFCLCLCLLHSFVHADNSLITCILVLRVERMCDFHFSWYCHWQQTDNASLSICP